MSDEEKLEFKVFLIGDPLVGRKTIINRFRIMKCTETKEHFFNNNLTKPGHKKELNNLPHQDNNSPQKKINENDKTNTTNETSWGLFPHMIKVIQSKAQKSFVQKKIENLTNFTKVFHIAKTYFELNFYYCPVAENLQFSDKINEDEDSERIHKMRFDKLKKFIHIEIQKPAKKDMEIKYIFLFVIDVTNSRSLDRIKVYYEELKKIYLFDNRNYDNSNNFYSALIGNKIDLKLNYEEINKDSLDSFIRQYKINYYEISGKLNFNFEKFFEKMFFDLFEKEFQAFSTGYFKNRFLKLLYTTRTFSKETREFFKLNKNPGPDNYKNNPYDLNEDKGIA